MAQKNKRKSAFAMVAALFLVGVSSAQAVTVTSDGDVATGIQNLDVLGTPYNVLFEPGTPSDAYGEDFDFTFTSSQDAGAAVNAVIEVLGGQGFGEVGPDADSGQGVFNIGFQDPGGASVSTELARYFDNSGTWVPSNSPVFKSDVRMWATFTVVPVPAAVWLFGSALGLLGWIRRKAS